MYVSENYFHDGPKQKRMRWEADIVADQSGGMGGMMQDLAFAIPGVDEAMGFAEIMKYVLSTLLS